jgi:hypothetical protein
MRDDTLLGSYCILYRLPSMPDGIMHDSSAERLQHDDIIHG